MPHTEQDERDFINRVKSDRLSSRTFTVTPQEIKKIMKRLKMNQVDLAAVIGVSQVSISRWLRGQSRPSRYNSMRLRSVEDRIIGFTFIDPGDAHKAINTAVFMLEGDIPEGDLVKRLQSVADSYDVAMYRLEMLDKGVSKP